MSKNYTGTAMSSVRMEITLFHKELRVLQDDTTETDYFAGQLHSFGMVKDADGVVISKINDLTSLGAAKPQQWTLKQIYDYFNGLCAPLAAKLKKLYEDGINVDPST